jgi:hypothetical protein
MAGDPINNTVINEAPFQITTAAMNLTFFDSNALDEATKTITFGSGNTSYVQFGQVGWDCSASPIDVRTSYRYLVVSLNNSTAPAMVQVRLRNTTGDTPEYVPAKAEGGDLNNIVNGSNHVDIDLLSGYFQKDGAAATQTAINYIYKLIFWEYWGSTAHKIYFSNVFLTNTLPNWSAPVTRATTSGNFGTICLSYPATAENAYIYTVSGKSADGKTIYLTHYNGLIQAGVPYIYRSLSDDGVKFYQIENDGVKATASTTENGLTGCLTATTGLSSMYACNGIELAKTTECAANQAYLDISGLSTVTSGDEKLTVNTTPITTGIYTDEYTPLNSSKMATNITSWVTNNSFADDTKTITFDNTTYGGKVGWTYSTAMDLTSYRYIVMAFNPQANSACEIHLSKNNNEYALCNASGSNTCTGKETTHIDLDMLSDYFINSGTVSTLTFDNINWLAFWDCAGSEHKLSLANVFLTNTLPSWDSPVTRTTTSGNYGTVCLPYPAICTDGYVYQIKSINSAKTQLTIEPYNGVMKPGVPYIYKSIGDGVNFYEINDSKVLASEASSYHGLVGCFDAASIANDNNHYVLKNNKWYLVNSTSFSSAANRAYINIADVPVSEASAKGMTMDLSEETTGVNTINVSNNGEEEATYTITGVKLGKDATLQRGIYIRGGKKFVVK